MITMGIPFVIYGLMLYSISRATSLSPGSAQMSQLQRKVKNLEEENFTLKLEVCWLYLSGGLHFFCEDLIIKSLLR